MYKNFLIKAEKGTQKPRFEKKERESYSKYNPKKQTELRGEEQDCQHLIPWT